LGLAHIPPRIKSTTIKFRHHNRLYYKKGNCKNDEIEAKESFLCQRILTLSHTVIQKALFSEILGVHLMSMHRSLKSASKIAAKRNVLKRFERVDLLRARGQWSDGEKVRGLRKTKPPV